MKTRDREAVKLMIELYCRGKHGSRKGELCEDCKRLWEYVEQRGEKCPFGDEKPFCSNCRIHCYKPDMREKIKAVMRYSGPRMLFYDPATAIRHLIETVKTKRARKKEQKNGCDASSGACKRPSQKETEK